MAAKAGTDKKAIGSIYVICGKDKFLVGNECDALLDKLLPVDQRPMALYQPRAEDAVISEVLDELRTLPFLAERRVVLIKDADSFVSENRDHLEKYFDKPSSCGVLVLVLNTWRKNTKLAKKLAPVGQLLDVGEISARMLPKFAADCAESNHGKKFAGGGAQFLVELVGDDPGRISSEVEKLAMYVGDRKSITTDDVEKLIGHNRMFNAFAVIDAILAGDVGGAIERLRNMFAADKSAEFTVVGAFAYHFRRMFAAKALLEQGTGQRQVMSQLRIWGNVDGFFRQLHRMSLERIATVICELARIDYASKTGGGATKVAIEQLVLKMSIG